MSLDKRHDVQSDNLVPIPNACQIPIDDHKGCPVAGRYPSPYHNAAAAESIALCHTGVAVSFPRPSIYPGTAVIAVQMNP